MSNLASTLPDDPTLLKAMIAALQAENAKISATLRAHDQLIQTLQLRIAKLKKQAFGQSSEKIEREIEQLELALVAKAFRSGLSRKDAFSLFLSDGRVAIDNNPAERALRPIGVERKNWLFAGADTGAETLARAMTIIETAKLNGLDPQAYLAELCDMLTSARQSSEVWRSFLEDFVNDPDVIARVKKNGPR